LIGGCIVLTTHNKEQILVHLRQLIRRSDCVLSYDLDLIDSLPHILKEQHGIVTDSEIDRNRDLSIIFSLLGADNAGNHRNIKALPEKLRAAGIALDEFSTRAPEGLTGQEAGMFDKWSRVRAIENVKEVVALQADLGMGRWNANTQKYQAQRPQTPVKGYLRYVTTAPPTVVERVFRKPFWELKFLMWKLTGRLDPTRPSLSIGPRWITEIVYFREVIGLRQHVGLDLFSDDPTLVVAGDMHDIPFPSKRFHFIFLKNTVDKSYNVRKLVEELLRVIEPQGLIVIDQICGYGGRCSPLSRTDIQRAHNLLRLFQARAQVIPLVCSDINVSGMGDARERNETRNNARLALRVTTTECWT
jgi:hypothetical protein